MLHLNLRHLWKQVLCIFFFSLSFQLFQEEMIVSFKCPKDIPRVIDAEWGQSDKPVVLMSDGCIRIFDLTMKKASSPMVDWDLEGMQYSFLSYSICS